MSGSLPIDFWFRNVLSLVLLTANIGAPFRSATSVRAFLDGPRQNVAICSMIRVRGVSPIGGALGFRVVVGIGKGGPDHTDVDSTLQPFAAFLSVPADMLP